MTLPKVRKAIAMATLKPRLPIPSTRTGWTRHLMSHHGFTSVDQDVFISTLVKVHADLHSTENCNHYH